MARLILRQDAEGVFLAVIMTATMEAILMRRNTWAKRSQSFFYKCMRSIKNKIFVLAEQYFTFLSEAEAITSDKQRHSNTVIGGNESGHNLMEAGNKH